jgi:hypothetical protein
MSGNSAMAVIIAKGMAASIEARPEFFDAPTIKRHLDDLVKAEQGPLEGFDAAFARVALKHETGKRLFRALRKRQAMTGEVDYEPPPAPDAPTALAQTTNEKLLAELAERHIEGDPELLKLRERDPEKAKNRALLQAIETPRGRQLWRQLRGQ